MRHLRRVFCVLGIVTALAAVPVAFADAPLKLGYGEVFPFGYTGKDGRPAGFVIDVFQEAARRENISIQWVHAGDAKANTAALIAGRLDVMPIGHASPERRSRLYISEPWWSLDMVLIGRADSTADLYQPRSIAVTTGVVPTAREFYPDATVKTVRSAGDGTTAVCAGDVEAALIGEVFIRELLLKTPDGCRDIPLRTVDSPVEVQFSIVSRLELRDIAERLRQRVNSMAMDGTLAAMASRHPPVSAPRAIRMAEMIRASYERDRFRILFSATVLIAFLAAVFVARQRATIGKQKAVEQALLESQRTLQQRTQDLLRSNEDLQSFAYSVSHDLQEPLRNQSLYSELLDRRYRDLLPAEAREYIEVIRNSAVHMNEMMRSLLVYSGVAQTRGRMSRLDSCEVVRAVLHDLDSLIAETGAQVSVGWLPQVDAWEGRLNQVFQNLIENALKYRKPDVPPSIDISCRAVEGKWLFAISDNGIGFNPAYSNKIFDVFKRLHARDAYGGSGIGLALCRRIVERHGGTVWAESREGQGSTFYFTLPRTEGEPSAYDGQHLTSRHKADAPLRR